MSKKRREFRYVVKPGWYLPIGWQDGYGAEYGDEDIDDVGPFETKEECEDEACDWYSPFVPGEPYWNDGYIQVIRNGKWVRLEYKERDDD